MVPRMPPIAPVATARRLIFGAQGPLGDPTRRGTPAIQVKGFHDPVNIYEVVGRRSPTTAPRP